MIKLNVPISKEEAIHRLSNIYVKAEASDYFKVGDKKYPKVLSGGTYYGRDIPEVCLRASFTQSYGTYMGRCTAEEVENSTEVMLEFVEGPRLWIMFYLTAAVMLSIYGYKYSNFYCLGFGGLAALQSIYLYALAIHHKSLIKKYFLLAFSDFNTSKET